jgi:short-subunit dehydrogenase
MGLGGLDFFHVYAENRVRFIDLINCNITSLTKMTAIVLPNMIKKRKGIIVNNGSGAGRIPIPLAATYSASKAYVDFFSRYLKL